MYDITKIKKGDGTVKKNVMIDFNSNNERYFIVKDIFYGLIFHL
jgi:hypothetical protein